jgi:beta-phosphoglucomutase-like phosphatase (HAD superfamily)
MPPRSDPAAYQALIFDCDGTLARTATLHHSALTEALRGLGHDMPEAFYRARTGLSLEHLLDEFAEVCGERIRTADVLPATATAFCRDIGQIREVSEVTAVVRAFAGRKPLAVASSAGRPFVHATLAQLGIASCFDAVITVEDIREPKPAPDAFLLAAARLGAGPEGCLVFEDSEQGLSAARCAGMDAIDVREPNWRIR